MAFGVIGTFNTGIDRTIVVTNNATGAAISIGGRRTGFTTDSKDKVLEGEGVDQGGLVDHVVLPGGVTGTIMVDRQNGDLDRFKAYLDAAFYSGQGTQYFTITCTTFNISNKTTDKEQIIGAAFHNYKPGEWKRERVNSSIEFVGQQRIQIQ